MRPDRAKVTQGVGFALPWAAISLGFPPAMYLYFFDGLIIK